ncbi:MAG: hypothetical protein Q7U63_05305 [Polaromonas sp.]|uniref:hypothetical protein n=1 Tax=Polaromonas sp. TaxID=1869339 RepID=UPI002728446C|nr:hypothetical protein [Polaromonas sp.]MDO9113196.1 hypothetical protein [Polaromonas sp.]MDP1886312.1 hypothetical protein [Polaromonas sp.]
MKITLLLATEADEGSGHIAPWAGFVGQALQQGFGVHMAAPNVGQLARWMGKRPEIDLWQAPVFRSAPSTNQASPKSWPELLLSLGYGDSAQLTGAVKAWLSVLKCLKPDIVLADYAPALLAAARVAGIPSLEVGGGFCVPPLLLGVQHFPGVKGGDRSAMDQAASALTSAFNQAFQFCGSDERMTSLSAMASWPVQRIVISPVQLDHYGQRAGVVYAGFLGAPEAGEESAALPVVQPQWPVKEMSEINGNQSARVLGYLKPETPGLQALIAQLRAAHITAYLVVPQSSSPQIGHQGSVTVVNQLVDLPRALQQADIYLSNGGLHGVGLALQAGCWPLVLPMQAEQVAMARTLVALQWGGLRLPDAATMSVRGLQALFGVRARQTPLAQNSTSAEDTLFQLVREIA